MDIFRLSEQESSFKELAARAHLRGLRANGVLAMDKYQVLMVDAPDVPVEELRAAVKWKIRDLINFHIDDVAIDVFDVPTRTATSPNRPLYVVAARSSAVRGLVDKLFEAGRCDRYCGDGPAQFGICRCRRGRAAGHAVS